MRRLAAAGITTREACGNAIRNVTACPLAGVCRTEAFDVTPYAKAIAYFLLGHPDTQDFGRKFKIAFSGCEQEACGLVNMHDMGAPAVTTRRQARVQTVCRRRTWARCRIRRKCLRDFVPEEELLPLAQAIARVFARLGEKQNRARARIKFLVAKLGIDEFRRLVMEERKILAARPAVDGVSPEAHGFKETPLQATGVALNGAAKTGRFRRVGGDERVPPIQPGYAVVTDLIADRRSHVLAGAAIGRHRAASFAARTFAPPWNKTSCFAG